jgi:hypothetical protein
LVSPLLKVTGEVYDPKCVDEKDVARKFVAPRALPLNLRAGLHLKQEEARRVAWPEEKPQDPDAKDSIQKRHRFREEPGHTGQ